MFAFCKISLEINLLCFSHVPKTPTLITWLHRKINYFNLRDFPANQMAFLGSINTAWT